MLQYLSDSNYFLFEIFFLFRLVAIHFSYIANDMLLQDKICLFQYNQTRTFCANIHHQEENVQEQILNFAITIGNYRYLLAIYCYYLII